jgi:hypothetical protein
MLFDKLKDTQFKSLKYGNDKPGGGTGPEPIIVKPILDGNAVGTIPTFKDRAAENKTRISALLKNTSRGLNFVSIQRGLQLSNTRLELSSGPVLNRFGENGGFGSQVAGLANKIIDATNSGIGIFNKTANQKFKTTELLPYNEDNTITQVGALQGEHLDRFGLTPYINDNLKYINIAKSNNSGINSSNNRLAGLRNKFSLGLEESGNVSLSISNGNIINIRSNAVNTFKNKLKTLLGGVTSLLNTATRVANVFGGNPTLNKINNKINQINRIAVPFLDPMIDQYVGGPGSVNGLGVTNIRRFDFTNTDATINAKANSQARYQSITGRSGGLLNKGIEFYAPTTILYGSQDVEFSPSPQKPVSEVATDFTKLFNQKYASHKIYGGADIKIAGTNTQYKYREASVRYKNITDLGFERNPSTPFKYLKNNGKLADSAQFDRNDGENMSILFQLVDPFTAKNLHRIIFPAYINGFRVNTDATWNDVSYIGRSENLYVYTKFKRQVSFGFQIPCFNIVELRERHRALGALESSLAGKYNDRNKLGGILTRLYFGNYFKGETGIINNISYSIPDESSWDIDEKLAHNIDVSVNFTVIHNELPTYQREGGFFNKTIANAANFFISSEQALIGTGAATDKFNENIPNYFTDVSRVDNFTLLDQGTNIPKQANDNVLTPDEPSNNELTSNSSTTGIINQSQFGLQGKQEASQIVEAQIASNNALNLIQPQF